MFLPVGAAFGALTRAVEFRTIATVFPRTIEFRTLTERTVAGGAIFALLPGLGIAALWPIAEILARATVGSATGEFLVAAKFSLRPVAETFAARGIGPLFAITFARRIRLLVAELPVGKPRGRAGVVAITARRAVVAVEVRAVAARRVRALVAATVFARFERTLLAVAVIAIESRRPRRIAIIAARRTIFAIAGVGLATARIGLLAIGFRAVGLAGIGPALAVPLVAVAFAGKTALGEFLLRPARGAGTALAAGRAVTPAAGIVVFIVIAGHEWSLVNE